jgi:signal transduction histidine kinase
MQLSRDTQDVTDQPPREQHGLSIGVLAYVGIGLAWLGLTAGNLLGPIEPDALVAVGAATLVATLLSVRTYQPSSRWPWYAICIALFVFLIGGGLASEFKTLGNLTVHRSMLPDVITLPGYAILAAGIFGFSRERSRDHRRDTGVLLDASLAAIYILACGWVFIISPALSHTHTPLDIRVVLACYPAASLFLLVVTVQVAFGPGQRRSPSYWLLLTAISSTFLGDILYMLAEIHKLHAPRRLLEIPYGIAYLTAGAGALHPSMHTLTEPAEQAYRPAHARRVVLAVSIVAVLLTALLAAKIHASVLELVVCVSAAPLSVCISRATFASRQRDQELERVNQHVSATLVRLEAEDAMRQGALAERQHLARELHDSVGRSIALTGLRAEAAARLVHDDPVYAAQLLTELGESLRATMADLRHLVSALRNTEESAPPPSPTDLESILRSFDDTDLEVIARMGTPVDALPLAIKEVLTEIIAEALTNAARHAYAHQAVVSLQKEDAALLLEVTDDGQGPPPGYKAGFGLLGISERLDAIGGCVTFGPGVTKGAVLRVVIPLIVPGTTQPQSSALTSSTAR